MGITSNWCYLVSQPPSHHQWSHPKGILWSPVPRKMSQIPFHRASSLPLLSQPNRHQGELQIPPAQEVAVCLASH